MGDAEQLGVVWALVTVNGDQAPFELAREELGCRLENRGWLRNFDTKMQAGFPADRRKDFGLTRPYQF